MQFNGEDRSSDARRNAAEDRESAIARAFALLADSVRDDLGVVDTMDILVETSTELTSGVDAGVLLADASGSLQVVAWSSESSADIEEAQLSDCAGPCFEAFETGNIVSVPNLATVEQRWPEFTTLALRRGFVSAHALPLHAGDYVIGSLNIFTNRPGGLTTIEITLVQAMADVASISVMQREAVDKQTILRMQLQRALESRVFIEQAKGVIAQQNRSTIDEAFRMLRGWARSHHVRLQDVARDVIARRVTV